MKIIGRLLMFLIFGPLALLFRKPDDDSYEGAQMMSADDIVRKAQMLDAAENKKQS